MSKRYKTISKWLVVAFLAGATLFLLSGRRWDVAVLVFTAVLIAWYSYETNLLNENTEKTNKISGKLRQEMVMSNKISITPGLIIEYKDLKNHNIFLLRNIGKAAALDINIKCDPSEFFFYPKPFLEESGQLELYVRNESNEWNDSDQEKWISGIQKITILFNRIKKSKKKLSTVIKISHSPLKVETERIDWMLD
ncbi:MAG TPA: hypothetical protein VJH21_01055 [Candidatus Paceibacterota bacterium]